MFMVSSLLCTLGSGDYMVAGEGMVAGRAGPRLNIKTLFPGYRDSHVEDKTVARPSYL